MHSQTSGVRERAAGQFLAGLAVLAAALAFGTPLALSKSKEAIQVKALAYRVETTRIPPIAPGQVVVGPLGPDVTLTEAVNRERTQVHIYQTVEGNGMVYTLTCARCNALQSGATFDAEIKGTTMWVKRPKNDAGGEKGEYDFAKFGDAGDS